MHEVNTIVAAWMQEAGMTTCVDEMGNLVGHLPEPSGTSFDGDAVWLIGSHLDTVPNSGKYDGVLGVLLGIEVVSLLRSYKLPFAVEVIGFSEEEGVRFKTPYFGSRALAGTFNPSYLDLLDGNGTSMRDAMLAFGLVPEDWYKANFQSRDVLGYLEIHIEQGPLLEALDAPLGIVTDIVGQSRLQLRFRGQAGHAGTQPMNLRRDALAAASEWVLAVEKLGQETDGLVATVGFLNNSPNTPNVVPREVVCTLDVRHAGDEAREFAVEELLATAQTIGARRHVAFEVLARSGQEAVPMNALLRSHLRAACEPLGVLAPEMASGAGHDAAIMATLCPCAMLFVRTPGGASHCPEEAVTLEDVALALQAMHGFFERITHQSGEPIESRTF